MLVNRNWYMAITFVMMLILSFITKNIFVSGFVTFMIMVLGYVLIAYQRLNLLEGDCNPEAFLAVVEKQMLNAGKNNKMKAYQMINKAAALITMGEFAMAKQVLLEVDKSFLSMKNATLIIYHINLALCLYELGELEAAQTIYETELRSYTPNRKAMTVTVEIFMAERLFFLGRYDESKELFWKVLEKKLTKRRHLSILYRLAQIDEVLGDRKTAKDKYHEVADNGNKLWIAIQAKKNLEGL